jgi:hypothetical protein
MSERIIMDPEVQHGQPVIRGARSLLHGLWGVLGVGWARKNSYKSRETSTSPMSDLPGTATAAYILHLLETFLEK